MLFGLAKLACYLFLVLVHVPVHCLLQSGLLFEKGRGTYHFVDEVDSDLLTGYSAVVRVGVVDQIGVSESALLPQRLTCPECEQFDLLDPFVNFLKAVHLIFALIFLMGSWLDVPLKQSLFFRETRTISVLGARTVSFPYSGFNGLEVLDSSFH